MRGISFVCIIVVGLLAMSTQARSDGFEPLVPPVDGAMARRFDAPDSRFSAGHRGIDYSVLPGTRVRAAGEGTVTFAGTVAGSLAVTISHHHGIETTYSQLTETAVSAGQPVEQGTWIGTSGRAHPGVDGIHFGVKVEGAYVDPAAFIGPTDLGDAIHLAPILWEPSEAIPEPLRSALAPTGGGSHQRACVATKDRDVVATAPNDNVAVAVAGIASKTRDGMAADMYERGPELLGYPASRVYRFSYAGADRDDLHRPYPRTATYGNIGAAAHRLDELLQKVSERHPGKDIDLIAHSQGGIVARTYLTKVGETFDSRPRVEHLVTFASPHTGAPIADNVGHLRDETVTGGALLDGVSGWSHRGARVPDPYSKAVQQLTPGSSLLESLAREDIVYGTRVLTFGIANDLIVPADRTGMVGERHHVIGPTMGPDPRRLVEAHDAILESGRARALAFDFLRGGSPACPSGWDSAGHLMGRAISFVESRLGAAYSAIEGLPGRVIQSAKGLFDRR